MSTSDEPQTLGDIIRRQRELAEMTMRELSSLAGISNPYLSQIENGLRAPSEHVLRNIAVSLGMDPDRLRPEPEDGGVREAIGNDPDLTAKQRRALTDVYESMVAATRAERRAAD